MSVLSPFSGAAAEADDRDKVVIQSPDHSSERNGQPVSFYENPGYPLLLDHSHPGAAEHFAVLRSRLLSAQVKSKISTVLITSPEREEGKSMICANLAISFGCLGRPRVFLVDADLRVRGLTRILRLQAESGLSEYLQGKQSFEETIRATTFPSLTVAAAGNSPAELLPALLEGPRWSEFLEQAKQHFDLVIVDSVPTAAPIADCELLAAACDGILLVVHRGKTSREALALAKKRIDRKLMGIIINNTDRRLGFDYYSYYRTKK